MDTQQMKNTEAKKFEEDLMRTGTEAYHKTQEAAADAYHKTAEVASEKYDQVKSFSRANPEKIAAIAFAAGLGLGLLFCARSSSRTSRSAQAVIDAVYDVATAFVR